MSNNKKEETYLEGVKRRACTPVSKSNVIVSLLRATGLLEIVSAGIVGFIVFIAILLAYA